MLNKVRIWAVAAVALAAGAVALSAGTGAVAAPGSTGSERITLEIDGTVIAEFTDFVSLTTEVVRSGAGAMDGLPATVVLRRDQTSDLTIWSWHDLGRMGDFAARKSAALVIRNSSGVPRVRYALEDAWPSKIEVASGETHGVTTLFSETITFTATHIQRVPV